MSGSWGRAALVMASIWLAFQSIPAWSHPHVWADMRSQLQVADDGKITGVRVEWVLDKAYAKDALDGLDANNDGIYEPDELARLTEENLKALADYNYFVVFRFNGEVQKNGIAKDGNQTYNAPDGRLTLTFTVPLEAPLDPKAGEVKLKVYDPEFFIDFEYVKDHPLLISRKLADGCTAKLLPTPSDASIEQTRQLLSTKGKDWKPENNEDFGGMFAQATVVECAK
jgi:ABC-type uncharacterized transport system substrate-binding protein